MTAPDYFAQTAEIDPSMDDWPARRDEWTKACIEECKKRGCVTARVTLSEDKKLFLFEAWKDRDAKQDEPFFHYQA